MFTSCKRHGILDTISLFIVTSQQGTACMIFLYESVCCFSVCFVYHLCNVRIDLNNVIKVADFGQSEDIYAGNYFRQTTEQDEDGEPPVKLPVKWMALGSLNDGIFSKKTDVVGAATYRQVLQSLCPIVQWSFGVTC